MKYLIFGTRDYYNRYKKWFAREDITALLFYVKAMKRQFVELGLPEARIYHFYDLYKLICRTENSFAGVYKKTIQYYDGAETVEKTVCTFLLFHDLILGGPSIALYHMARVPPGKGRAGGICLDAGWTAT